MARPRIVEKDYYRFQKALQRAVDIGKRIDVSEIARWKAWVKEKPRSRVSGLECTRVSSRSLSMTMGSGAATSCFRRPKRLC